MEPPIFLVSHCDVDLKRNQKIRKRTRREEEDDFADDGDVAMNKLHQILLMLFDSPLAKAGLLQAYLHTTQNQIIQIDPSYRVPRTIRVFKKVMRNLFGEASGRVVSDDGIVLLKILGKSTWQDVLGSVDKTVTFHNCAKRIFPRSESVKLTSKKHLVEICASDDPSCICHEADVFRIDQFSVTTAVCVNRVCNLLEELLKLEEGEEGPPEAAD